MRRQGGKKVPPPLQRFRADDLLSTIFPETTACLENHVGDLEVPDHPLVRQTVDDCLTEAMDVRRWVELLGSIERGEVELIARDTREPSPFSYELLNANPYAFLDDAPLEERRARAVATRRAVSLEEVRDLATLDAEAIAQVRAEAAPIVRDADELHDLLLLAVAFPAEDAPEWQKWFDELVAEHRAAVVSVADGKEFWVAAESWPSAQAIWPDAQAVPPFALAAEFSAAVESTVAVVELLRGWLATSGPIESSCLASRLGLRVSAVGAALEALEGEGVCAAWTVYAPRRRRAESHPGTEQWTRPRAGTSRMVRAPAPGADSPFDARWCAAGRATGRCTDLHAFSLPLAAYRRGGPPDRSSRSHRSHRPTPRV